MTGGLTWAPAWRLTELVRAQEVSPSEVLEHFLGRIEEHQPVLRAFDYVDATRARRDARKAEAAVLAGGEVGPLIGVPIAVKGHIPIEGVEMPFGGAAAPRDDVTVQRLRLAGAVIVGHTNMPVEIGDDYRYDYAASARNAWDTRRTAGVSSSGSAAAVAGGLLPACLGSDGAGSVRLPSAYSGLVGVHPTAGLVPFVDQRGQTLSSTSTIGPITRDVRDAATVLSVISGPDGRDEGGLQVTLRDPAADVERGAVGMKLAWTDDFGFALDYAVEESHRVVAHIRKAALAAHTLGASIEPTDESWEDYLDAFRAYSYRGLASWGYTFEGVEDVSDDGWDVAAALRERTWLRFQRLFAEHDLLLCPTIHSVAPTVEVFGERLPTARAIHNNEFGSPGYVVYTALFNWLKLPAMSVPCGFVDGLPVGMQIVGPPGSDHAILRFAHAFCHAFPQTERPPGW